jgi:hypothetical protein
MLPELVSAALPGPALPLRVMDGWVLRPRQAWPGQQAPAPWRVCLHHRRQ